MTVLKVFSFSAAVVGNEENARKKKKKKKQHKLLGEVGEVQCKTDYQLKSSEEIPPLDTSQWPLLLKVVNVLLFMVNIWWDVITAVTLILLPFRILTSCVTGQKVVNVLLFMVNIWWDAITAVTLILLPFRILTNCVAGQIITRPCHLVLHHLRGTYVNMCVQDI
jgi:hypothetical protein